MGDPAAGAKRKQRRQWPQVREALLQRILKQGLGSQLPSAEHLARHELKCSVAPVIRALRSLQAEGFLTHGRGRRAQVLSHVPNTVQGLSHHARELGFEVTTVWAEVRLVRGDDGMAREAARALKLEPSDEMILISRVRRREQPASSRWDRAYMPAREFPASFLSKQFAGESAASLLDEQRRAGFERMTREFTVSAAVATDEELDKLLAGHGQGKRGGPAAGRAEAARPAVLRVTQTSLAMRQGRLQAYEYLVSVCKDWALTYHATERARVTPGR